MRAVAPLGRASEGDLSFLGASKYAAQFATSRAGITLVGHDLAEVPGPPTRILVDDPYHALLTVLPHLYVGERRTPGVHATVRLGRGARVPSDATVDAYAVIGDGVQLGSRVWIGAHCVVERGVIVGDDVRVHPGVVLYSGTSLGHRVIVHAGVRLGSDGFGYAFREGVHEKVPHVGRCIIGDDVEIGANTTIDRGSIDDTVVGAGTKIDNLVHIAHNVHVGRLCLIMAQVGIAGSARLGDGSVLAGQVGVAGHVTIGADTRVGGQAGVFGDVPAGSVWSGYPARPHAESMRAYAALFKLPPLLRTLERVARDREARDREATERRGRGSARGDDEEGRGEGEGEGGRGDAPGGIPSRTKDGATDQS